MPRDQLARDADATRNPRDLARQRQSVLPTAIVPSVNFAGAAQVEADRKSLGSVTLAHDYLNQRGGAERVALELTRLFPEAPMYTSLYRPDSVFSEFQTVDVRTTFLDRLPIDRQFRVLAPLLPLAFETLPRLSTDLVISSTSGWAHGVRTAPHTTHVVYCHAPARWLYSADAYLVNASLRGALRPMSAALTRWDVRAARRADRYITNAQNVRQRVRAAYGIDSDVVYPPVDTERFTATARGERLLCISRLLPYKRIDLLLAAVNHLGVGLDVIGDGPMRDELRALAGPTVAFHGKVPDAELIEFVQSCNAVCLAGTEDFGIAPLEGNAAGKPALAFAAGGAIETIDDGVNGVLFTEQTTDGVVEAIRRVFALATEPTAVAQTAERFSVASFRRALVAAATRAIERHNASPQGHR